MEMTIFVSKLRVGEGVIQLATDVNRFNMSSSKPTIFGFLIFGVILGTGLALICKQCNVDCQEPVDEECLEPGDEQEVACLVETFKDQHNKTLYQRKCVLYKKDTKFECADYPNYTSVSCVTCKENRCNRSYSKTDVNGNKTAPSDVIGGNKTAPSDVVGGNKTAPTF